MADQEFQASQQNFSPTGELIPDDDDELKPVDTQVLNLEDATVVGSDAQMSTYDVMESYPHDEEEEAEEEQELQVNLLEVLYVANQSFFMKQLFLPKYIPFQLFHFLFGHV